jgi:acetolactate synthase-1/2/3 large subunit
MTRSVLIRAKRSGAWLVRYALEQLPVTHTLGIPGVHNTEIYDELSRSEKIEPVLVTHEAGAAFAADGISRTSGGTIGTLLIVPAAGVTHAMSGIGEAFLDGIPMLVISGGIRTDVPFRYQLHELDQRALLKGLTKGAWRPRTHAEIVPAIFEAYRAAVSGVPGPVLVEIPVNLQLFQETIDEVPVLEPPSPPEAPDAGLLEAAVGLLEKARSPGLFVGWGAVDVTDSVARIAERLGAPVATTLQGLSAFSAAHPLHAGMGFSRAAVPAAENAFADCDCLLAIGTRFAEIPTGSFGCRVPEELIHVDIDPAVLGANFPARVAIAGDARAVVPRLLALLAGRGVERAGRRREVEARIQADKKAYREEWLARESDRVNPARFFASLRLQLEDDALMAVDDGNHTFLAAELFPVTRPPYSIGSGDSDGRHPSGGRRLLRLPRRRAVADLARAGDSLQPQDVHRARGDPARGHRAGDGRRFPLDQGRRRHPRRHTRSIARGRLGAARHRGRRNRLRKAHAVHAGRGEDRPQPFPARRQVPVRRPRARPEGDGLRIGSPF